ncbi:hypothetical protein AMC87_CH02911 [Rhizobium phaseoli]|uniref:hypothetical protein n=1 Tax=Rhizobium phaseoli TaxID=396 RepID=UPI0007F14D9E|nr:hypothetical protein [Rhizobium phaseoli]ANL47575.1 hypothetical protein AMC87_CH02911 [Rhizobium phaseoli]
MNPLVALKLSSILVAGLAMSAGRPYAQDICETIVTQKALNIYDSNTVSSYQNQQLDSLCREHWSSTDDYNNKSKSLGSGGNYGAISGFLNLDTADSSQTLEKIYDKLCVKKDAATIAWLTSSTHTQSADAQIAAWQACVEATQAAGVWSSLTLTPGSKNFTIDVWYKFVGPAPLPPLGLTGYDHGAGYSCKFGDSDAANDLKVNAHKFALSCERTSPTNITASINTDSGLIGPYLVPDDQYTALTARLDQLSRELSDAKTRLSRNLETSIVQVDGPVGGTPVDAACPPEFKVLSCTALLVPSGQSMCDASASGDQRVCNGGGCNAGSGQRYRTRAICGRISMP